MMIRNAAFQNQPPIARPAHALLRAGLSVSCETLSAKSCETACKPRKNGGCVNALFEIVRFGAPFRTATIAPSRA